MKETRHKRPHNVAFILYQISRIGKFRETESILVVAHAIEERLLTGSGFLLGMVETVLNSIVVIVTKHEYTETH